MRLFILLIFLLLPSSVNAKDTCEAAIKDPLEIVKGMADFKAAMDAGYAACTVNYPEEFAPMLKINDFMQINMQAELDQAHLVLEQIIDKENPGCHGQYKDKIEFLVQGQYKKAYSRRYKAMSQADLVGRDQDSCLIVLEMVQKYDKHFGDFRQLEFVLYEASKKKGKASGVASNKAYKAFEKTRDNLKDGDT